MGDVNLEIKLNKIGQSVSDVNTKTDENTKSILKLNTISKFKNQCELAQQSNYNVEIEDTIQYGNIALMTITIKSITQESYPSGNSWIPIITLPFNNKGILTKTITSRNGDYKPIDISCNNSNQVFARGGSIDSSYTDTILLLK